MTEAKRLAERLPGMAVQQRFIAMSEAEARFLASDVRGDGIEVEASAAGLHGRGGSDALKGWETDIGTRRQQADWAGEMFAFEHLES